MNKYDYLIIIALIIIVYLIIKKMMNDKKNGISSCNYNCGGCPYQNECHKGKENDKKNI